MTANQESVLSLVDRNHHKEALLAIENLDAAERTHGRIQIAQGDAFMNSGMTWLPFNLTSHI